MSVLRIPLATYRLQLHKGFTLDDAAAIVPALARLGVTDIYLSPFFTAVPGSLHGYDICDHGNVNPELGGEEALDRLHAALQNEGMGLLLDFVPNHMAAHPSANAWWRDVLEHGPASPHASFFDIDWSPAKPELKGKLLLPILGDPYGRVLERGELRLEIKDGGFCLRYFEHDLPINPRSSARILDLAAESLKAALSPDDPDLRECLSIRAALANLPADAADDAQRQEARREAATGRDRLKRLIETSAAVRRQVAAALVRMNGRPGEADTFDLLHDLLEAQPYRLANWRTSLDEINYRRFFDVNGLAGLRQEDPDVFRLSHAGLRRLAQAGKVTGVRLDHVDGLHDPAAYLASLQRLLTPAAAAPGFYTVVEKILTPGEELPVDWPVHGTTGYDFLNEANGLFVDARSALPLKRFYVRFTGRGHSFAQVSYESKYHIMVESMTSELGVLAHQLNGLSERDRAYRDFTLESLRRALREVVAAWPLYRTYVAAGGWTAADEKAVDAALARVRQRHPGMEPSILEFIRAHLLPDAKSRAENTDGKLGFAMRFQQYTAPVQAKGVEDTAFYRHIPLLSLNEVGGGPQPFGRSAREFHEANGRRAARHPHGLLSTATHDTKRGEDARQRINVLSELTHEWRRMSLTWARINAPHRSQVAGAFAPDRNEEYFLYQTLVGAWPAGAPIDEVPHGLLERLQAFVVKALREEKSHTSWIHNNPAYEDAVRRFLERTLAGPRTHRFLASFAPFLRRVAFHGALNSLAQVALKGASPGVPDFYQGTELWDLSLADPDNRRPVNFARRADLLRGMSPFLMPATPCAEREAFLTSLLTAWPDGRVKLFVTAAVLAARRRAPSLFLNGDYTPLPVEGPEQDAFVAFTRCHGARRLLLAVPRRTTGRAEEAPVGARWRWDGHRLVLPDEAQGTLWRNVLTGRTVRGNSLALEEASPGFPVALLVDEGAT